MSRSIAAVVIVVAGVLLALWGPHWNLIRGG